MALPQLSDPSCNLVRDAPMVGESTGSPDGDRLLQSRTGNSEGRGMKITADMNQPIPSVMRQKPNGGRVSGPHDRIPLRLRNLNDQ